MTIIGLLVVAVVVCWVLWNRRPTLGKMDKRWLNEQHRNRSGGRRG